MIVYRLSKRRFAKDLSGKGAEITGGRWNSKGKPVLYTSQNRSLCLAEVAVHIPLGIIPVDYLMLTISVPEVPVWEIPQKKLKLEWRAFPYTKYSQELGNSFLADEEYLIGKFPSAVVPGEFNYLINPRHKDIDKVKVLKAENFEFDRRMFL